MEDLAEQPRSIRAAIGHGWKPALGLLIALILPFVPIGRWIAPGQTISALLIREAVWWSYAAAVIVWLLVVEQKSLSSIGFRAPTWRTFVFGFLAGLVLTAILISQFAIIIPLLHLSGAAAASVWAQIMKTPYWYRVLMVLRAAVVEEILFRAYLMEKVHQLTGSWAAAIFLSVVAFTGLCICIRAVGRVDARWAINAASSSNRTLEWVSSFVSSENVASCEE